MTPTLQPLTEVLKTHKCTNAEHLALAQHGREAHVAGSDGPAIRYGIKATHTPDASKQP